MKLKLKT